MTGLRSLGRSGVNRSVNRSGFSGGRLYLLAAALFAGAAPFAAIAQAPPGVSGWRSAQSYGSAVGNPEHGRALAAAKCASCHGADGNSADPQYPKLAGQNPAYLYWQLWAFKRGTRNSDAMSSVVSTLSDADMADAASFYGQQTRRPDNVGDPRAASIGEHIFFSGMPSCAMCHGSRGQPGMMGRMPMMGMMGRGGMMGMMGSGTADVPNLNGQHAAYLFDQLNKFSTGERQGTVMNRIAPALSEVNRKAVAEFLSGAP